MAVPFSWRKTPLAEDADGGHGKRPSKVPVILINPVEFLAAPEIQIGELAAKGVAISIVPSLPSLVPTARLPPYAGVSADDSDFGIANWNVFVCRPGGPFAPVRRIKPPECRGAEAILLNGTGCRALNEVRCVEEK